MKLYLITGFLGAGKTTFLKEFLPLFKDKTIHLIINEFGKAGVDGALLEETGAVMSQINNGSIFCACRLEQFEQELEKSMNQNPDFIIVEASGLSDPTNVEKILRGKRLEKIEYAGSICLVDVPRFEKVIHTARVCPKQLMVSSVALLNKTDLAQPSQIQSVMQTVREFNPMICCHKTTYGKFNPEWLSEVQPRVVVKEGETAPDLTLQKYMVTVSSQMLLVQLKGFLTMVIEDTWRIKGIVTIQDGRYFIDCVGPSVWIEPYQGAMTESENQIVFLAGEKMPLRKSLKEALKLYGKWVKEIKE